MHPIAARVVKQSKLNKIDVSGMVEVAAKSLNQTSWIVDDVVDQLLVPRNLKLALSSLDAKRLKSLHHLLYERTLLLNFIARTCYMTEAYAYTHLRFMLVAGDTLGHARMCELVHDDTLHDKIVQTSNTVANVPNIVNYGSIWTMLPFDLVRSDDDEYGNLMEDPCRPRYGGFTQGMDATELRCRAHAKALLHRTLYLLQQKHGFHGGVDNCGPYTAKAPDDGGNSPVPRLVDDYREIKSIPPALAANLIIVSEGGTPRGHLATLKKKSSFSGREIDATGGATHVGAIMYPVHYCAPLPVPTYDRLESMPYGKHSMTRTSSPPDSSGIVISTKSIDWGDIVKMFKPLSAQQESLGGGNDASQPEESVPVSIFAPYVKRLEKPAWEMESSCSDRSEKSTDDEESQDEDISDTAVFERHITVLDAMKQKLDVAMQEHRTRNRS